MPTDDLVARLRTTDWPGTRDLCADAADEIEWLRAERDDAREEAMVRLANAKHMEEQRDAMAARVKAMCISIGAQPHAANCAVETNHPMVQPRCDCWKRCGERREDDA